MNPLNNDRVSIVGSAHYKPYHDQKCYEISIDGERTFTVERNPEGQGKWQLKELNNMIIDKDQFRQDLFERIALKFPPKKSHFAKIGNRIVEYSMADSGEFRNPESFVTGDNVWIYIGCGTIYSINGVRQSVKLAMHFWKSITLESLGDANYQKGKS